MMEECHSLESEFSLPEVFAVFLDCEYFGFCDFVILVPFLCIFELMQVVS